MPTYEKKDNFRPIRVDIAHGRTQNQPQTTIMKATIARYVASIADPRLSAACQRILDTPEFFTATAAKGFHHARDGGLAQHTAEVVRYALHCLSCVDPEGLHRDVLIAAGLWHDYGKIREYVKCDGGFNKTPFADTIGHICYSAIAFCREAAASGVDQTVTDQVTHAILAHHGRKEWGSPVEPQSIPALILYQADMLSAKYGQTK